MIDNRSRKILNLIFQMSDFFYGTHDERHNEFKNVLQNRFHVLKVTISVRFLRFSDVGEATSCYTVDFFFQDININVMMNNIPIKKNKKNLRSNNYLNYC